MKIAYVSPGLKPCGGIRILIEHVNRLARRGHDISLVVPRVRRPDWITVDVPVMSVQAAQKADSFDAVVATGYQTVNTASHISARRRFWFVQMAEWEFHKPDTTRYCKVLDTYPLAKKQNFHVITISRWVQQEMWQRWKIESEYVDNAVNRKDFYPDRPEGRLNAILIEGDARNCAKDVDGISWRVAKELRCKYGVELWGYAALHHDNASGFDKFLAHVNANQMREIYSQALFLLKASRFDARACAPVEAMACGTTCARAIIRGDDDLINDQNCLRTRYDYDDLLEAARRLMEDEALRRRLEENALAYADTYLRWNPIIDRLEKIYAA